MRVPVLSKMQTVASVPAEFPILEARRIEAKVKRCGKLEGKSFRFRLAAVLASDTRGGKRWDI